jgi:hypothetical protein
MPEGAPRRHNADSASESEIFAEEIAYSSPDGIPDGSKCGKKLRKILNIDGLGVEGNNPLEKTDDKILKSFGINFITEIGKELT